MKIDFASGTDLAEANYLGYKTDYIHIKSNSWGPSDVGYLVDGPGPLLQKAMENAVREVKFFVYSPCTKTQDNLMLSS